MKKTIAIITARGGSKRIPHKNIKDFLGKPILAYSIEAALSSGKFDHVMVSTDDTEIAEIAKKYGAEVPFMRSPETSNDYATTADVLCEVIDKYKEMGEDIGYFCCIYPTAPFITAEKLKKAMELIVELKADSVVPVVPFSFPPQRSFSIQSGKLKIKYPEYFSCRSQDLEPSYHDCGQFYVADCARFLKEKILIMQNTVPLIMSETEVQDIDNEDDWVIAEMKYKQMCGKK